MIRRLREGKVVWYAPDQDYGPKQSVFAPFFGVPAASIVATMRIAEMGRAVVVPLYHYRDENDHYHVEIQEPLENFPSGDDLADAARVNAVIERNVARYPDQYFWVHRRFKTRPEGEPPCYPLRKRRRKR
jgi:KDO2-lipid IV(A) lauroyltransferase